MYVVSQHHYADKYHSTFFSSFFFSFPNLKHEVYYLLHLGKIYHELRIVGKLVHVVSPAYHLQYSQRMLVDQNIALLCSEQSLNLNYILIQQTNLLVLQMGG